MIKSIQHKLLTELPGWEAHKKMAPPIRLPLPTIPKTVRYSAVCILLFYKNDALHTLLIKRTDDGKTHGGQISFPGGRLDHNDFSLTFCALRECTEEIGLQQEEINVLGRISDLYIPPSNFMVSPIVCFANRLKDLTPSPLEVAEILEVPLSELFDDKIKKIHTVRRSDDFSLRMKTPIYELNEHVIWGATAMILSELEEIYRRVH